jgi:hypothetical protein
MITILLLTGSHPLNAIVVILLVEIVNPYLDITLSNLCTDFCNKVSDSSIMTWSSAKRRILLLCFLLFVNLLCRLCSFLQIFCFNLSVAASSFNSLRKMSLLHQTDLCCLLVACFQIYAAPDAILWRHFLCLSVVQVRSICCCFGQALLSWKMCSISVFDCIYCVKCVSL